VSGQLHAPAVLPPGKSPTYPLGRRLDGPQRRSWRYEEEKNMLSLLWNKPRFFGRSVRILFIIPSELLERIIMCIYTKGIKHIENKLRLKRILGGGALSSSPSSWGETESTAATVWPIVPAPDDRLWWWWWLWSHRWDVNLQGKRKYTEETCSSVTLATTNPIWPDPGSNPATNHLSYGAGSNTWFSFQSKLVGQFVTFLANQLLSYLLRWIPFGWLRLLCYA
jgi:hypothetical protein